MKLSAPSQHKMAESAPLLDGIDENTAHIGNNDEDIEIQNLPAKQTRPAYFKVLTIVTLILSVISVGLLIAGCIIAKYAPIGWYTWLAREASETLAIWIFVSVIFSFINVLVNFPMVLNMVVDVVLASGIIASVVRLFEEFPGSNWCQIERGWPRPGNPNPAPVYPHPKCEHWKLVVKILMGIAGGFAIIIAAIYLVLLLLRTIVIFRTKFWKSFRPLALSFPTGTISFEISLKLLKPETGQSAEASGSQAGHGPLYL